jgi:uncharacterized protein
MTFATLVLADISLEGLIWWLIIGLIAGFLALTIGFLGAGTGLIQIGGWIGIITALLAWYTALAGLLASGKNMFSLPVGPRA